MTLTHSALDYAHGFHFDAAVEGIAFGRHLNSAGDESFPLLSARTFAAENAAPLPGGPVVINEIHYRPPAGEAEFVELRNLTGADRDLAGARLAGFGFTFPAGAFVPANGFVLVVTGDAAAFRAAHNIPPGVPIYATPLGTLQDDGERVELQIPSDLDPAFFLTLDALRYNDRAPWPYLAAGDSLQRIGVPCFGDEPRHWLAAAPTPGAANSVNAAPFVALTAPVSGASFTVPAAILLRAAVGDPDGTVAKVEFFVDALKIGEATQPPFEFVWANAEPGLHDLTARATDDLGAVGDALPVTIEVTNPGFGAGLGLKGEYFSTLDLSGPPVTRVDPTIDFHWNTDPPAPGIAARWPAS